MIEKPIRIEKHQVEASVFGGVLLDFTPSSLERACALVTRRFGETVTSVHLSNRTFLHVCFFYQWAGHSVLHSSDRYIGKLCNRNLAAVSPFTDPYTIYLEGDGGSVLEILVPATEKKYLSPAQRLLFRMLCNGEGFLCPSLPESVQRRLSHFLETR